MGMGVGGRVAGPVGALIGSTEPANRGEHDYSKDQPWPRQRYYEYPKGDATFGSTGRFEKFPSIPSPGLNRVRAGGYQYTPERMRGAGTPFGMGPGELPAWMTKPGTILPDGSQDRNLIFTPKIETQPFDDAATKARETGERMKQGLSIEAQPTIDTASLDAATQKAQELMNVLRQIGGFSASPSITPNVAPISVPGLQKSSAVMRSAHADISGNRFG
jgi:hypothetical protein